MEPLLRPLNATKIWILASTNANMEWVCFSIYLIQRQKTVLENTGVLLERLAVLSGEKKMLYGKKFQVWLTKTLFNKMFVSAVPVF